MRGKPQLRAPDHGGRDSGVMTDSIPVPWRTLFRRDGGQFDRLIGMLSAMRPERALS
jgi:hypothetical protein